MAESQTPADAIAGAMTRLLQRQEALIRDWHTRWTDVVNDIHEAFHHVGRHPRETSDVLQDFQAAIGEVRRTQAWITETQPLLARDVMDLATEVQEPENAAALVQERTEWAAIVREFEEEASTEDGELTLDDRLQALLDRAHAHQEAQTTSRDQGMGW